MPDVVIDAKDYGATGDGSTDDLAALQAAIDAAFGTAASPNADSGSINNRGLFIPNGIYNISAPLVLTQIKGAHIFGAGKLATRIQNTATSGSTGYGTVFRTDGCTHGLFEDMHLKPAATGSGTANIGFDLAWRNTAPNTTVGNFANTFVNVRFENGDHGCRIGFGTAINQDVQGSEVLFRGCDFINIVSGAEGVNQNALNFTVIGGLGSGCGRVFRPEQVSTFPVITGVRFVNNFSDVRHQLNASMVIEGCTSTSFMLAELSGGGAVKTKAIYFNRTTSAGRQYAVCGAKLIMDACLVGDSSVVLQKSPNATSGGTLYMRGCSVPGSFTSGADSAPTVAENI